MFDSLQEDGGFRAPKGKVLGVWKLLVVELARFCNADSSMSLPRMVRVEFVDNVILFPHDGLWLQSCLEVLSGFAPATLTLGALHEFRRKIISGSLDDSSGKRRRRRMGQQSLP